MAPTPIIIDVLIIGGSHAGLSAALTIYRGLHTTVIFDSHSPRNSYGTPIHSMPGWEFKEPEAFREASREELRKSGLTKFVDSAVENVQKTSDGLFEIIDNKGDRWLGRKLLLATGMKDVYPDLEGYLDCYSKGIFPCMLQFGYEQRGCASAGLLALDSLASVFYATNLARDAHKFTDIVTIYTNANTTLANDIAEALTTVSMRVDDRKIKRLIKGPGKSEVILEFEGGGPKTEGFLVHRPLAKLDRTLADQLGLEFGPIGEIKVNPPFHQTSVPGVYAAGDCASMFKIIPNAISMGSYAGAGVARELPRREIGSSEDWNPLDQGRAELEALLA